MKSVAAVTSAQGARFIQRIQSYFQFGFNNLQPHCYGNNVNSINLRDTLLAVKTNFPFGFDVNRGQFVSKITWDFSKLDLDKPVSSLSVFLAIGIFLHSKTILKNVGRKKIKEGNQWTFRKSTSLPAFDGLHVMPTFKDTLLEIDETMIDKILDDAQSIINTCCRVEYSETAQPVDDIPHYYNFLHEITYHCLNLESNILFHQEISLRQRKVIALYNQKIKDAGRLPTVNELNFFSKLIDSLKTVDTFQTVYILRQLIQDDISLVKEIIKKFDLKNKSVSSIDNAVSA